MGNKILITGGSGFIGSNLIKFLSEKDEFDILNVDIVSDDSSVNAHNAVLVDLLDEKSLFSVINQFSPHYVIHLAARTDLKGSKPGDYAVNTIGALNLMNACKSINTVKKIIFCSSMLVCKVGYTPATDTDYCPANAYGQSKVDMEKMIRAHHQGWQWTIVRPTSIWGPGFKEPYRNFFDTVAAGRFFDLGKHYCSKTYGYIGNTVYQIYKILENPHTDRKTFYLGDNPPIFISEWGKEIAKAMNVKKPATVPFFLIKAAAYAGDLLKYIGINFPMTSFRLKNMTTDNILDLTELYNVAPHPPFSRQEGVELTVNWLNQLKEETK